MWQAVASGEGMGGIMDLAMIPWKIGAKNAQAAEATYNQKMQRWAQATQAREAMHSEQLNIANIKAQRILSDMEIEANQRKAEAQAKVQAAAAGVSGGAVQQVVYTTEANESFRKADLAASVGGMIEQSLENIYGYGRDHSLATQEEFKSMAMQQMMNAVFGMAPGAYGLYTGQGPSGMFGLFGEREDKRVDKGGNEAAIFLS